MTDQELADKVVALGIGQKNGPKMYVPPNHPFLNPQYADDFVRDWRVAGALMEKCAKADAENGRDTYFIGPFRDTQNINFPRAIIEACVEARS